jgi:tetratricopeptide (TPR) repeat protein
MPFFLSIPPTVLRGKITFAFRYGGADPGVQCVSFAALILWQLGYPDQALKKGNEVLTLAQGLSHPFSLAFAEYFVGVLRQSRREARSAQESAEALTALSTEHGLTGWLPLATTLRGWAMAAQEHHEEGIAQIQEGLAMSLAIGAELARQYHMCLLAEASMEAGRLDDGLGALTEALSIADRLEIHSNEAEIHRLKGELLLPTKNDLSAEEARKCFEWVIEIARQSKRQII